MDHAELRELAAGAALDDLEPDERAALDRHLATCGACAALAAELDDVLADLALAAPDLRPPTSLQGGVLAAIRSGETSVQRRAPWRLPAIAGLAAAAVLAVAAAGLAWQLQSVGTEIDALRAAVARDEAVMAVAADPDHRTAGLHAPAGPSATVVWLPDTDDAWLVSVDLPATPDGRVYQLWHADADGVHPLGTFHYDGRGTLIAPFGVDLSGSSAVMVTLEPEGGAIGDPGPEVVFGEL